MSLFFINSEKDFVERFDIGRFLDFNVDNFDPLTSSFFIELKKLPINGRFTVQGEEGRPDLVSKAIFDTIQHWWVILLYNDIVSIDDIVSGDILTFPSLEKLEDLLFALKSNETALT